MNKTPLLELAKKLNIPRRNCMKTKEELEEAIKDTIKGYKEIIFDWSTPTCMACLDELRKQHIIDQHMYDQRLMDIDIFISLANNMETKKDGQQTLSGVKIRID